jgi:hypothetical protein
MTKKVYIYSTDKYGNPGAYFTTLPEFKEDLAATNLGADSGDPVVLHENIDGDILDQDGHLVLVPATKETIEGYSQIDDPMGLNESPHDFDSGLGIGGLGRHQEKPIIPTVAQMERMEQLEAKATTCRRCGQNDTFDGAMFTTGGGNTCDDCF